MTSRYGFERIDPRRSDDAGRLAGDLSQRDRDAARERCRRLLSRLQWMVVDILTDYKQALTLPGEVRHSTEIGNWTPVQSPSGQWGFRESPYWEIRFVEWHGYTLRSQDARLRMLRDEVFVRLSLDLTDADTPRFVVQVRDAGQGSVVEERNRRRLIEVLRQKTGIAAVPAGAR